MVKVKWKQQVDTRGNGDGNLFVKVKVGPFESVKVKWKQEVDKKEGGDGD